MDYKKTNAPTTTTVHDLIEMAQPTGNIYETVCIISKRANQIAVEIKKDLEKKLDALVMRELYTKYKTAPSEEEREKARREYLDKRGVPESFRW